MLAAFDAGINFFFLSVDMHWPLCEGMRRGLEALLARGGGVRDEIVGGVVSYLEQPLFQAFRVHEVIDAAPCFGVLKACLWLKLRLRPLYGAVTVSIS